MAGGDFALIKAVEGFEDIHWPSARNKCGDLGVCAKDVVFAITEAAKPPSSSARVEGVEVGAKVYFVYNNPDDVLCQHVQRSRE